MALVKTPTFRKEMGTIEEVWTDRKKKQLVMGGRIR